VARLGRSQPANWLIRKPLPALTTTQAGATLPIGTSVTGTGTSTAVGNVVLPVITNATSAAIPPATGQMNAGVSLTAGGSLTWDSALAVTSAVTAIPSAWLYIGGVPVTYLQYMSGAGGTLTVPVEAGTVTQDLIDTSVPGQAVPGALPPGLITATSTVPVFSGVVTEMHPASGYPYHLAAPPPDGRWVSLGGGGLLGAEAPQERDEPDPLAWDPPPHLAHLPVPFDVIRRRIEARQRRREGVVVSR
jgi:hypothetical protein